MKTLTQLLSLTCLCLFFVTSTDAQDKRIGLSTGYEMDMINPLTPGFIEGTSDIDASILNGMNLQDAYSSSGCENIHFRFFSSLPVNKFRNTSVYAAFIGIFNRSDRLSYYDENYNYIGIGAISNELALEFSLDKRLKILNIAYLDLGLGNNVGYGFGGKSYVHSYNFDVENQLNNRSLADVATANDINATMDFSSTEVGRNLSSVNTRIFGKIGAGIIFFNRVELGLIFRYGYGARIYSNNYLARTQYNSIAINSALRF